MGEAKRKNKLRNRVFTDFPYCIYCGGVVPATTVDHFPPKGIFDAKQRPQGFEFSACFPCNSGARKFEADMVIISRLCPSEETKEYRRDLVSYFQGAKSQWDKGRLDSLLLLKEIILDVPLSHIEKGEEKYSGSRGAGNLKGPMVKKIIHAFSAKMGYALHFHLMRELYKEKRPVSLDGAVYVFYQPTNDHLIDESDFNPMEKAQKLMGNFTSMRQGKWDAGDQFRHKGVSVVNEASTAERGMITIHCVRIRQSLDIYALVCERKEGIDLFRECIDGLKGRDNLINWEGPFTPGFLHKFLR